MKIMTVTVNPVFDIHLRASRSTTSAAGKGVNVSRALSAYGVAATTVVAVGKDDAEEYVSLLEKDGITPVVIPVRGGVRQNVTTHDGSTERTETVGTALTDDTLFPALERILTAQACDIVVFSGSLRAPSDAEKAVEVLTRVKKSGAKEILDSRSFTFDETARMHPYMIKPNEEEAANMLGDSADYARLCRVADNVLITLGGRGAILLSGEESYALDAPHVDVLSTVGAGDAAVAGAIVAMTEGLTGGSLLEYAVAFGTAACMSDGTLPPKRENADEILRRIKNAGNK